MGIRHGCLVGVLRLVIRLEWQCVLSFIYISGCREAPRVRGRGGGTREKKSSRAMGAEADAGETGGGGADGRGGRNRESESGKEGEVDCTLRWACGGAGFTGEGF